jgi:predicted transcriptional regulator
MADIVKQLKDNRQKIEDLVRRQNQREGELNALMAQFKEDFGVDDVDAARAKRDQLNKELDDNEVKMAELDQEMATIIEEANRGREG